MTSSQTISLEHVTQDRPRDLGDRAVSAFVLLWSRDEPDRVGEIAMVPGGFPGAVAVLGRAPSQPDEAVPHVEWLRQRPGSFTPTGPLRTPQISREQLRISAVDRSVLQVENIGRNDLLLNGQVVGSARVVPGSVLEIRSLAVMLCTARPFTLPSFPIGTEPWPEYSFGAADRFGIVGESPAIWELRQRIAFLAPRAAHVLVRGPSGSGKELVAQAIHSLSPRGKHTLVTRNAATIPDTLVDAELFGNARNYPNPGMSERPGLVGEADGSTLFLDEFGELPAAVQAHLLRVLDLGEYTRLGEARQRRSDFRLIGASNRPDSAFKEDVLARFRIRVEVPDLNDRPEDIPLLTRHLLVRIASNDPALAARWFPNGKLDAAPRVSPALITALVRRGYTTHVRELETLLWRAMTEGSGNVLEPWPELLSDEAPASNRAPSLAPSDAVDPMSLAPEAIQEALDRNNGRLADTWKELGLSSRHVLARLIKRYNLVIRRSPGGAPDDDED